MTLLRLSMVAPLMAVVLVEATVGRTDLVGWIFPPVGVGNLVYLEERVIRPASDPTVLIFGTSRARGAFLPTRMEQELGLPRGAVLNLALGGASIFDASLVHRRSRGILKRARTVIVQVDPFQFNAGPTPGLYTRRYGTWTDRLAYRGRHRLLLLWDYVFRLNPVLPEMASLTKHVLKERRLAPPIGVDSFGRLNVVRIANNHDPAQFTDERLRYWLDWQYDHYWYSPGLERMLLGLIADAHDDGARVFIVIMPTVARYYEMLRQYPGDPYGQFIVRLQDAIGPHADGVGIWVTNDDAGLDEADFRDWGHLNTRGAARWSASFSRWMIQHEGGPDVSH